ncbi:hypothetical protein [Bacteroides sp. KG122]|uniref:hypothetical protein n=1 Tax=Bacteroides sp. KG122 TaxID=3397827 RepID=UPI003D97C2E2
MRRQTQASVATAREACRNAPGFPFHEGFRGCFSKKGLLYCPKLVSFALRNGTDVKKPHPGTFRFPSADNLRAWRKQGD